ncbi:3'-5' exonuclease [Oceanimonas pelagia]|uniref:3'-5' exonuclease n=1 Tax=Oceanimonas pelagia TaxID=3028314 RepID=A0AA50KL34_9GAMM|nr:3'-5' exonuclease [Oceanimonas pelagia]WMC09493.1 3'-5' exonuclease [Oceanimonas pelagia]
MHTPPINQHGLLLPLHLTSLGHDPNIIYLDCESTGLGPTAEPVEIGIYSDAGEILLDTLVRPVNHERWDEAQAIHHISPEMVRDAPTLAELEPTLTQIIQGKKLVIYNSAYDVKVVGDPCLTSFSIHCAMKAYAPLHGEWNERYQSYKWCKLTVAAEELGHVWEGDAHRAIHDCMATRTVWRHVLEHRWAQAQSQVSH